MWWYDFLMTLEELTSNKNKGFTILELLLVLGIISILAAASMAVMNGISAGRSMGSVANSVAETLESARNVALSHNTYVWIGFASQSDAGGRPSGLVVAAVESVTGQVHDLATPANLRPIMKPLWLPNVSLASGLSIAGMDTTPADIVDVSSSALSPGGFTANVSGTPQQFTQVIQFSAQGETLVQSTLYPWVTVGVRPIRGKVTNYAALQISGTTGEVRQFQP